MMATRRGPGLPTVLLRPGEAERVAAGHPWIYKGMILRVNGSVAAGDVVQVKDHRERFVGVGFYNARSNIVVRVLAADRVTIDEAFFERRFRAAQAVRRRYLPQASSYRLVSAEADFLSGLIVDRYEDVLVLQISSLGMGLRKAMIVDVLQREFSPRAIVERGEHASRRSEGLPEASGVLSGTLSGPVNASINGLAFEADVLHGQKTGLYLDQQVNQRSVAGLLEAMPDASVLDCFSFVGGFGLHCAQAGAAAVQMIDQSEDAIAAARRNAAANGLLERCSFRTGNVFDWLKAESSPRSGEAAPRFDLVVLDPPPFAPTRAAVPGALRGYKEIHLRALKLVKAGGMLATFCCSHHVDARLFEEVILSAARDVRRIVRRVAVYTQSPDHPIIPAIPETEYLKGFALEVLG